MTTQAVSGSDRVPESDRVSKSTRQDGLVAAGLGLAGVVTVVAYGMFVARPWPHTPLNEFLAAFDHANAVIWPMPVLWYVVALAMIELALLPTANSSRVVCLLAAAYLGWIGIAYFAVLVSHMSLAGVWAVLFVAQGALLVFAGVARQDLVIRPGGDLSSLLGAFWIVYALAVYPVVGLLGGHPLGTLPLFGLAPCPTVIYCFGLLLWARPPLPRYLLLLPLAWSLVNAPPALGTGIVADWGMVLAAVTTTGLIIWRDRRSTNHAVVASLLLALLVAWSGHDNVVMALSVLLIAATFVWGRSSGRRSSQLHARGRESTCPG
jgi:hypothetical protein